MDKQLLQLIIADQQSLMCEDIYVKRAIPKHILTGKDIVVISGIRRCGKSTLLHQIRSISTEKDFYMNFDDDRLVHFNLENFQELLELFIELFGVQKTIYFDEIQNIKGWERFVRRLHDHGYKIFITGSNATMLSRELGTHLSGRYISHDLYPFSFTEYLTFIKFDIKPNLLISTEKKALVHKHFQEYFSFGGFPYYLMHKNRAYLKSLYESILYKDIMVRNNLTNEKELTELVYYLASNVGKLSSFNALSKLVGIANPSTIKNYVSFLQNSYLIFTSNKYDFSVKKQILNPKKIYFIDNAMIKVLGFYFSDDLGRLMENLIFIELKRRGKEVFYYSNKVGCDFVIRNGNTISQAIQVSYSISERQTRQREITGLLEAMKTYKLKTGIIITNSEEQSIKIDDMEVKIIPAWRWLIEG